MEFPDTRTKDRPQAPGIPPLTAPQPRPCRPESPYQTANTFPKSKIADAVLRFVPGTELNALASASLLFPQPTGDDLSAPGPSRAAAAAGSPFPGPL